MEIGDSPKLAFLDTGSVVTLIKETAAEGLAATGRYRVKNCDVTLSTVTGERLDTKGVVTLPFKIGSRIFRHNVIICDAQGFPGDILIGLDLLQRVERVDFELRKQVVTIGGVRYTIEGGSPGDASLSVTIDKAAARNASEKFASVKQRTTLAANTVTVINAGVPFPDGTTVLVEEKLRTKGGAQVTNIVATVRNGGIPIEIVNTLPSEIQLARNERIATVSPVHEDSVMESETVNEEPQVAPPDLSHLSASEADAIKDVLRRHRAAVSQNSEDIGRCDLVEHYIETGDHAPIATRQWPLPHSTIKNVEEQCEKMRKMGVIEPCHSAWQSPTLLVRKKNQEFRFCVDYRKLNSISVKDKFPIPRIEIILQSLRGAKRFTTLDLKSGYWQIKVAKRDRDKTAFATPNETYRFKRLPFGLHNGPATFQRLMQLVLRPVLGKIAYVFLDDIIVFSRTFDEHVRDLEQVLTLIERAGLKVSPEKCEFGRKKLKYLGHVVTDEGIQVDPEKVEAVQKMTAPKNPRDVRRVMGMAGYYRRFIAGFSEITAPLTDLTKKKAKFVWDSTHQTAFERIKQELSRAPVLQYPDYGKAFQIHTDASGSAIGGVLTQQHEGTDLPVAYFSRKLNPAETRYTVSEKEALAIVASVKHFSHYVFGHKFEVITDHAPLKYLFTNRTTVPRITKWALLLSEYCFDILYRPGKDHVIPDALSRSIAFIGKKTTTKERDPADVFDPKKVRNAQLADDKLAETIAVLEGTTRKIHDAHFIEKYTMHDGCLFLIEQQGNEEPESAEIKLRLVVPESLRQDALYLAHDSTLGGHFGVVKSVHRAKRMFYWPSLLRDVRQHIAACTICQRRKHQGRLKGKIQNFPAIYYPLQRVGVDLIGKLTPSLKGKSYILTIVDHFSRYVQAYALENKEANTIATAFLDYVCRHGCPENCVSDRGGEFTSNVSKEIGALLKIKLHFTTSFHPQSNGLTEAFNKLIKDTLVGMVHDDPRSWDDQLNCAVLALNCSYHASIKNVPYTVFYGRAPPLPYAELIKHPVLNYSLEDDDPASIFARMQKAFRDAKIASENAHDLTVKYQKVKPITLKLADTVFLSNDARKRGPYSKFQMRWTGPYRITAILSPVNYEIEPVCARGRKQIVHINRLKQATRAEEAPYFSVGAECNERNEKEEEDQKTARGNEAEGKEKETDPPKIIYIKSKGQPKPKEKPKASTTPRYALRSLGPVIEHRP